MEAMVAPVLPAPRTEPDMGAWALVEAAQAGDREAFGCLYNRYADVVFRYVVYRVGDRVLAEDLTSETFLRALRRIGSVSYCGRDVGAWLVTIARNLVVDHRKRSSTRLEVRVGDAVLGTWATDRTPEGDVVAADVARVLRECVVSVPTEDQREVLRLRFFAGMSIRETAEVMGRSEESVKSLQHRAVQTMVGMGRVQALGGGFSE